MCSPSKHWALSMKHIHKVWWLITAPASGGFPTIFLGGLLIHCDLLIPFEVMQDIFSEIFFFKLMVLFVLILINIFQHFKYFVFGSFPQMCIHVHLPAPVAVKLSPSYLLHLDFMCEKKKRNKTPNISYSLY